MLRTGMKIIERNLFRRKKLCPNLISRVTLDNFMKHFHHRCQEHLADTRLLRFKSRRAALTRYYENYTSKSPESALYI